jgi:hypothetical protein
VLSAVVAASLRRGARRPLHPHGNTGPWLQRTQQFDNANRLLRRRYHEPVAYQRTHLNGGEFGLVLTFKLSDNVNPAKNRTVGGITDQLIPSH